MLARLSLPTASSSPPPPPPPPTPCLSSQDCIHRANHLGLSIGGGGYAFTGWYGTKGCYTYDNTSEYHGIAFYGLGGNYADMALPVTGQKIRVTCEPLLPPSLPPPPPPSFFRVLPSDSCDAATRELSRNSYSSQPGDRRANRSGAASHQTESRCRAPLHRSRPSTASATVNSPGAGCGVGFRGLWPGVATRQQPAATVCGDVPCSPYPTSPPWPPPPFRRPPAFRRPTAAPFAVLTAATRAYSAATATAILAIPFAVLRACSPHRLRRHHLSPPSHHLATTLAPPLFIIIHRSRGRGSDVDAFQNNLSRFSESPTSSRDGGGLAVGEAGSRRPPPNATINATATPPATPPPPPAIAPHVAAPAPSRSPSRASDRGGEERVGGSRTERRLSQHARRHRLASHPHIIYARAVLCRPADPRSPPPPPSAPLVRRRRTSCPCSLGR